MDFNQIVAGGNPVPPGSPPGTPPVQGFGAAQTPTDPVLSQIQKPAQTPQEFEARKSGWQMLADKLTSNPNLMQALGVASATLLQPIPVGGSVGGQIGKAFLAGDTAFQAGKYSQWQQGLQQQKADQSAAESEANVAGTQARTAATQQQTDLAARLADAKVSLAKSDAKKAALELKGAQGEESVAEIERQVRERKAQALLGVSDKTLRASIAATYDKILTDAKTARANLKAAEVKADTSKLTYDAFSKLPDAQKLQFLTKSGPYANTGAVSKATATRDIYGALYDGLVKSAPNDPRIKGKTRDQFILDNITSQKTLDATTALKNYITAVEFAGIDPDPEVMKMYSELIKSGASAKLGTGGGQTVTGKIGGGPTGGSDPLVYKGYKFPSQEKLDAFKAAGG